MNFVLLFAKILGSKALLDLALRTLDEVAKKTDNKIDDEVVTVVKSILIENYKEKKEMPRCRK
jgi:hypothetical protein